MIVRLTGLKNWTTEDGHFVPIFRRHEHFGVHVRHLGIQYHEQRSQPFIAKEMDQIYCKF